MKGMGLSSTCLLSPLTSAISSYINNTASYRLRVLTYLNGYGESFFTYSKRALQFNERNT